MLYELRTYTLKPGRSNEFEQRWAPMVEGRQKLSPLGALWRTEIGPPMAFGSARSTASAKCASSVSSFGSTPGGAFGETAVQASSADQGKLSIYAALRSDRQLTVIVINKTASDLSSIVSLANFTAGPAAKVWVVDAAVMAS